jgi:hypothetical protein
MIDHHYSVLESIRLADGPAARKAIQDDILSGGEVLLLRGALAGERERELSAARSA